MVLPQVRAHGKATSDVLVHSVEYQVVGNNLRLLSCGSESDSFEAFVINSVGHFTVFQLIQTPAGQAKWI